MFYFCFCYNAHVHVADNVQQRPLGSHFSVGRRIRCNTGAAGLRPKLRGRPVGFDGGRTATEASAAVRQLRRGELGGNSASPFPEYNPFLLQVAVHVL